MSIPPILGSVYHLLLFSVASVFYLLIRMLGVVVAVLLYIFAPLTHLLQYLVRGALIPVHILGKFETLYIYLGVAALIGLSAGSVLHMFSSTITKMIDSYFPQTAFEKTPASRRLGRDKGKQSLIASVTVSRDISHSGSSGVARTGAKEYFDRDSSRKAEARNLTSQTILEEEDDSEND